MLPSEKIVRAMIESAKVGSDLARREKAQELLNAYYGDDSDDMDAVLSLVFDKPKEKLGISMALMKRYADTAAVVFTVEPSAEVVNDDGDVIEADTELFNELARRGRWWDKLHQANVLEKVTGGGHVSVRPMQDRISLDFISPASTIVWQDELEPSQPVALMYRVSQMIDTPTVVNAEQWTYWDADAHFNVLLDPFTLDLREIIRDENNPEHINPYGILPFVKTADVSPADDAYWPVGALDILSVQRAVNVGYISLAHAMINQGFTITYSTNTPDALYKNRGPDVHLNVEGLKEGDPTPTFGALKLDADLPEMVEAIESMIQQAVILRGLPPHDFRVVDNGAESGRAKIVARATMTERRRADAKRWKRQLGHVFEIIKTVHNTTDLADPSLGQFTEGSRLRLNFPEPEVVETQAERIERFNAEVKAGYKSPVDVMMEIDPDLDREQAEDKLRQNAADRRILSGGTALSSLLRRDRSGLATETS